MVVQRHHLVMIRNVVVGQATGRGVTVVHQAGDGMALMNHLSWFDRTQSVREVSGSGAINGRIRVANKVVFRRPSSLRQFTRMASLAVISTTKGLEALATSGKIK